MRNQKCGEKTMGFLPQMITTWGADTSLAYRHCPIRWTTRKMGVVMTGEFHQMIIWFLLPNQTLKTENGILQLHQLMNISFVLDRNTFSSHPVERILEKILHKGSDPVKPKDKVWCRRDCIPVCNIVLKHLVLLIGWETIPCWKIHLL